MRKKALRFLALLLSGILLAGCGGKNEKSNENSKKDTGEKPAASQTVLCLTKILSSGEDEEYVCNVTYEEDGVHITPENPTSYHGSTVYDATGKILCELSYNDEGINTDRTTYTYNGAGLLTEKLYWDVEDDSLAECAAYTYNDQGLLVKLVYENHGIITHSREYAYDSDGFLTTEYYYGNEGVLRERYEYTTNSEGQFQSCKGYRLMNSDEPLGEWGIYTYSYDSAGRLLSKVWELTVDYSMSQFSDYYVYDENGNIIRYETISHRKKESRTESSYTYTYNEDGFLISTAEQDGYSATYVYAQIELPAAMAEMAQKWSCDGVKAAFVQHPED